MSVSVTLKGQPVESVDLHVPYQGVPMAKINWIDGGAADLTQDPLRIHDASGAVLLELKGIVQVARDGAFAGAKRWAQYILGAGGWGKALDPKNYHNDAGVQASSVAADAAADAGELLGTFSPSAATLAVDYARRAMPASIALEAAAGGATWWVGYDGITHVGPRPESTPDPSTYRVLDMNPRIRDVEIAVDDPAAVQVGALLQSERFSTPLRVRSLDLHIGSEGVTITAHCGIATVTPLADAVIAIVRRELSRFIWGAYRYRVVQLVGDRLVLQAVSKAPGLPDLVGVSMWPGVGGSHTKPVLSSLVLVEFEEGSPQKPYVSGFVGRDGSNDVPQSVEIGHAGKPAARQSDTCTTIMPPMVITGTMMVAGTPTPFTAVGITPTGMALGSITTGSALLSVGTDHG